MSVFRRFIFGVVAIVLIFALLFIVTFHETIYGLIRQKCFLWEEQNYRGRPLQELRANLGERSLFPVDPGSFYAMTGNRLRSNQYGMRFVKGDPYRWFFIGSAVNVGYVMVETEGETDRVIDVFRCRSVDAP